jgi:hypothetical protein
MNLTDFRDQLEARAAEADRPDQDPMPVLHQRIRTARRRRTVVAAAGATLAVALVATVVPGGLGRLNGSEQTPATPAPSRPADVVKGAIRFPGTVGGDTLIKAAIGEVGQEFSFDVDVPASGETWVRPVCELPGTTADTMTSKYWVQVWVGGRMQVTSPCGEGEGAEAGEQYWVHPIRNGVGIDLKGMYPGQRARITVRVGLDDPEASYEPNRRAQVGVGVYRLGPMHVVQRSGDGRRLPLVVDHQGLTYRLADVRTGPASQDAAVTVPTPADTPFLVRYLTIGSDEVNNPAGPGVRTLRLTGLGAPITATQRYNADGRVPWVMPRLDPVAVGTRPAGSAAVTLEGPDAPNRRMLLAVYRLER